MIIVGLQKTTLIDYPGLVAATVFTYGCSFKCGFCHNPDLVIGKAKDLAVIDRSEFFDFLKKRQGILEGVVITGGEPLINKDMPNFMKEIKELGYKIKLDTNGSNPAMLETVIKEGLVDYIAMDIKNSLGKYELTVGTKVLIGDIKKSIRLIMESGLAYEFRSTVLPQLHEIDDFEKIGEMIRGAEKYVLQGFRPQITLDPALAEARPFTAAEMASFQKIMAKYVFDCEVRDNL